MYKKISIFLFLLIITSLPAAFAMSNAPKYCPEVDVIKATPFTRAIMDSLLGWGAMTENSKYDTQDEWTTMMLVGSLDDAGNDLSESDAIALANIQLPRVMIAANSTPEENKHSYFCFYFDNLENPQVMAITKTPAYENMGETLLRMKKVNSFYKSLTLLQ